MQTERDHHHPTLDTSTLQYQRKHQSGQTSENSYQFKYWLKYPTPPGRYWETPSLRLLRQLKTKLAILQHLSHYSKIFWICGIQVRKTMVQRLRCIKRPYKFNHPSENKTHMHRNTFWENGLEYSPTLQMRLRDELLKTTSRNARCLMRGE